MSDFYEKFSMSKFACKLDRDNAIAQSWQHQADRIESLEQLVERLKQEAQIHAMEARTANATIAEIYQCVSGATGEPGNWNGAEPVRKRIADLEQLAKEMAEALDHYLHGGSTYRKPAEQALSRYREVCVGEK